MDMATAPGGEGTGIGLSNLPWVGRGAADPSVCLFVKKKKYLRSLFPPRLQ